MKILTIKEVANVLKINSFTAYRFAKEGKIPAVRIGRTWRIDADVLEKWLSENSFKSTGAWKRKKTTK